VKHHPSCREDHEAIEDLLPTGAVAAHHALAVAGVMAQMSIANRLASIEDLLGARLVGEPEDGAGAIAKDAARRVAEERYGGSR
jgi:hypothetical protein